MTQGSPTETLRHEHEVVGLVLEGTEKEAQFIRETGQIHCDLVERILDFSRNFTDRCHHTKEEKHLFCKMGERGIPCEGGPIAMMLYEHEQGRQLVREIAARLAAGKGGNGEAIGFIRDRLFEYVELLRAHISKENDILFPMADDVLESRDQRELAQAFEEVEAGEMGPGTHERYHRLAHELSGR